MKKIALFVIYFYRLYLSSFLGGNCQFYPSCSEYSKQCFEKLPAHKAAILTIKRILRCHPFAKKSYDPAPLSLK